MAEKVKTESLLENIFANSPNAITVTDLNGNIIECNQATLDMHGYSSEEELIGKSGFALVAKKDRERAKEDLKEFLEQGSMKNIEYTALTKDGGEFLAELCASVIKDSSGNPTGFVAITKDITERKQVEEALRESEEKFRNIFESANDAMIYVDRFGRIIDVNRKAMEVFGGSEKELLGKHFTKVGVLSLRDIPRLLDAFAKGLAGKKPTLNICIKNKKGREIPLECSVSLLKAGMIVIARDITERNKAEEIIRASEERYRSLVELAPDSIMTFDLKGAITSCNTASTIISGYSKDELVRKHFSKVGVLRARDSPKYLRMLPSTLRGKVPKPFEVIWQHKNGTLHIGEVRLSLMKENGKTIGIQAIMRDITDRKKMEEQLKEYAEHLEEKVEERTRELKEAQEQLLRAERLAAIGEVAGMVGHDLRNPLQVMVNTFYLAKKKMKSMSCPLVEKHGLEELCCKIQEQLEYMNKIVSDLQDYARPLKPELVETSLHQLINYTLSTIKVPETVKVSIMIEEDFPKLRVDPQLMKRVFTNLITNALQAMPDGGQLMIRLSKKEETAFISIQDTGVGIPKENLPKLFHPLFTTKSKGTGFGLPVCKRLVKTHDGSITVESKVGRGSTFTVKMPLRREVS